MNSKNRQYYFKPTYQRWCFIAGVLALLSLLSPARAELDVPEDVLSNIQETGTARIIVTLKMPEQPDGGSAGAAAVDYQRDINQVQEQFFIKLYPPLPDGVSNPMAAQEIKHQYRTIPAVAMEVEFETFSKIRENSLVASVEKDGLSPLTLPDSTHIIGAVDGDGVWQLDYSGAGQAVVVLDTGVDKTHPDLADRIVSEACYSTTSSFFDATSVCPNGKEKQVGNGAGVACNSSGCNHGTHIAGIVAANGSVTGVAKDANIIAIQVFTLFNSPQYCGFSVPCLLSFTSDQIAGLERVLELHENGRKNIASVNMSLGGGNYQEECNGAIQGIINNLRAVGIATIVASGNGYHTNGIASPACISSAISVGATTKSDAVASYSNSADFLDLLAPGSFIKSTRPGDSTGFKSGTSMAAPHVAGAFAVLKEAAPDASVDKLLMALKETGTLIEDWRSGIPNPPRIKPRIDLKKALERLAPDEPSIATALPCQLYAVNDKGLNNSQFFTVSLDDLTVNELGPMYKGHDIEALAIHPETNMIYAASGDNVTNGKKGHFYRVDGKTGELFPVDGTDFEEIEDLAFSSDGTLYAWAKGDGLITIDLATGKGKVEISSDAPVEGLALSEDQGMVFYGAVNIALDLWKYNPNSGKLNVCTNLPGETEALEMMPNGLLLFGTHNDSSFSLHAFDPQICEVIADADIPTGKFNDVEGIALSTGECAE